MTSSSNLRCLMLLLSVLALVGVAGSSAVVPTADAAARSLSPPAQSMMADLWRAVAASGKVEAHANAPMGEWRHVERGDSLPPLSRLRTDEGGRATLTRQGDLILVEPGSELVLPAGSETAGTRILQRSGSAHYHVEPRPEGRFEVMTPYLVAGVKGTDFSMIVQEEFAAVSVSEGRVQVQSMRTGRIVDLLAGEMAIVEGEDGVMEVYRDGFLKPDHSGVEPSANVKEARKQAKRLHRRATHDRRVFDERDGLVGEFSTDSRMESLEKERLRSEELKRLEEERKDEKRSIDPALKSGT